MLLPCTRLEIRESFGCFRVEKTCNRRLCFKSQCGVDIAGRALIEHALHRSDGKRRQGTQFLRHTVRLGKQTVIVDHAPRHAQVQQGAGVILLAQKEHFSGFVQPDQGW